MESDAELMERSLVAAAPNEAAMRAALFDRFLARYPITEPCSCMSRRPRSA